MGEDYLQAALIVVPESLNRAVAPLTQCLAGERMMSLTEAVGQTDRGMIGPN
jgi:hypothetical protein